MPQDILEAQVNPASSFYRERISCGDEVAPSVQKAQLLEEQDVCNDTIAADRSFDAFSREVMHGLRSLGGNLEMDLDVGAMNGESVDYECGKGHFGEKSGDISKGVDVMTASIVKRSEDPPYANESELNEGDNTHHFNEHQSPVIEEDCTTTVLSSKCEVSVSIQPSRPNVMRFEPPSKDFIQSAVGNSNTDDIQSGNVTMLTTHEDADMEEILGLSSITDSRTFTEACESVKGSLCKRARSGSSCRAYLKSTETYKREVR